MCNSSKNYAKSVIYLFIKYVLNDAIQKSIKYCHSKDQNLKLYISDRKYLHPRNKTFFRENDQKLNVKKTIILDIEIFSFFDFSLVVWVYFYRTLCKRIIFLLVNNNPILF